ncbi:hypothetical protein EYF80_060316 [Liparis tanakae]|uniref:Uncharacterized protein n=1 Tax=Liparis tanakae TaxID=230148 RepID=A0A4Z2EL96_9TELE|nr:hypothetical protein EYF80_060316 [Liparis tanakae]
MEVSSSVFHAFKGPRRRRLRDKERARPRRPIGSRLIRAGDARVQVSEVEGRPESSWLLPRLGGRGGNPLQLKTDLFI